MNDYQKLRRAELALILERNTSELDHRVRDILIRGMEEAPCAVAYILQDGAAPSPEELIAALWKTENGVILRAILEEGARDAALSKAEASVSLVTEINSLPPRQRISAARAAGLT